MLVQTAVVVLLTAAPALVQAAPLSISTGVTALNKLIQLKQLKHTSAMDNVKMATKAKKHPGLKINTGARKSMSPTGFSLGTHYGGRYTPSLYSGRQIASPYGGGYVSPFTPSYASPYASPYPYSPRPIVSPAYSYVRRDTILSPRELSPRALTSPIYSTPMAELSTLGRAAIGIPAQGAPTLPSAYMRRGSHYRKSKATHKHSGNDLEMLERLLEESEKVVNGLEEQLNKPKTLFPELEAVTRKIKKMHTTKLTATAKLVAVKPATPAPKPATPVKSG